MPPPSAGARFVRRLAPRPLPPPVRTQPAASLGVRVSARGDDRPPSSSRWRGHPPPSPRLRLRSRPVRWLRRRLPLPVAGGASAPAALRKRGVVSSTRRPSPVGSVRNRPRRGSARSRDASSRSGAGRAGRSCRSRRSIVIAVGHRRRRWPSASSASTSSRAPATSAPPSKRRCSSPRSPRGCRAFRRVTPSPAPAAGGAHERRGVPRRGRHRRGAAARHRRGAGRGHACVKPSRSGRGTRPPSAGPTKFAARALSPPMGGQALIAFVPASYESERAKPLRLRASRAHHPACSAWPRRSPPPSRVTPSATSSS